jgi:hypothetical protein
MPGATLVASHPSKRRLDVAAFDYEGHQILLVVA